MVGSTTHNHDTPRNIHQWHARDASKLSPNLLLLARHHVTMLVRRPDHTRQTLGRAKRLRVLLRVVAATPSLEALGLVDNLLQGIVLVLGVEMAHAALGDEDLDLAVQRVGKVLG